MSVGITHEELQEELDDAYDSGWNDAMEEAHMIVMHTKAKDNPTLKCIAATRILAEKRTDNSTEGGEES